MPLAHIVLVLNYFLLIISTLSLSLFTLFQPTSADAIQTAAVKDETR